MARDKVRSAGFVGLLVAAVCILGGCGTPKVLPKETDTSGVPPLVLEAFRRDQPNSILLSAREVRGEQDKAEWKLVQFTPRHENKTTYYTPEGDKLRGW